MIGAGIGLGVGIIIGITSQILMKWNKSQRIEQQNGIDTNKVKIYMKKIEDLHYMVKSFYSNNYYKYANVIIIAIDKSNENYNDCIMYGKNLKYLNAADCPKKETPGTNREYYDICFELMHKFIEKYEKLFNTNKAVLGEEVTKDFENLKCKKTLRELKELLDELKPKQLKIVSTKSSKSSLNSTESYEKNYESKNTISEPTKENNSKKIKIIEPNYA